MQNKNLKENKPAQLGDNELSLFNNLKNKEQNNDK